MSDSLILGPPVLPEPVSDLLTVNAQTGTDYTPVLTDDATTLPRSQSISHKTPKSRFLLERLRSAELQSSMPLVEEAADGATLGLT